MVFDLFNDDSTYFFIDKNALLFSFLFIIGKLQLHWKSFGLPMKESPSGYKQLVLVVNRKPELMKIK